MKRIDTPNKAVDLFGAGKHGFKEAVPGVSNATQLTPVFFNQLQESIVRIIEAAGMVPGDDYDQFTAAVSSMVTAGNAYLQSGAGAVAETLQSKLRRVVVDLEEFGGVGDWNGAAGFNNTPAILKAIAKLGPKGGTIQLHGGKAYAYDPAALGVIATPIIFRGDGRASTSLVKMGNAIGLNFGPGAAYGGVIGLMLDSAPGRGDVSDGIYVSAGRIEIHNVGIQNQGGKGLNLYSANCSSISDLMILQCADDLFYINGYAPAPDVNGMTIAGLDLRVSTNGAAFRNVNGIGNSIHGMASQGCVNGGGIVMGGSYNRVYGAYSENNGGATKGAIQFSAAANFNVVEFTIASDLGTVSNASGSNSWILPNDTRSYYRLGALTVLQDAQINNISVGNGPGSSTSNTRVGTDALKSRTGASNCTAGGNSALTAVTGGSDNTGYGYNALLSNTTGSWNTAIGSKALRDMVTGDVCTAIGYQAGRFLQGGGSMDGISGAICVGANSAVSGGNQCQLGESTVTTYVFGTVQNRSDRRDKADDRDTLLGLDFINVLRPVDYRWDMRDDYRVAPPNEPVRPEPPADLNAGATEEEQAAHQVLCAQYVDDLAEFENLVAAHAAQMSEWRAANGLANIVRDGSKKRTRFHHGLIAQEVKAACDALGVEFGGYQDHTINGGEDVLSIGYDEFIGPLIKAVQELSQQNAALRQRLDAANL